jgi:hypothetical protein
MEIVNNININKAPFVNVRSLLVPNTNGYKVIPSLSGESYSIPILNVQASYRPVSKKTGVSSSDYLVTVVINCVAETYEESNDLLTEVRSLLEVSSKSPTLSTYNMNFSDENVSDSVLSRGGENYKIRVLTLQYVVL